MFSNLFGKKETPHKTLYIMRHAKSSWDQPGLADFDRPLMKKGIERTAKISKYLIDKGEVPEIIISSAALRARETARLLADKLNYPVENIITEESIYGGDEDTVLSILYALDNNISSALIVGHNPTVTILANLFLNDIIEWLPTSAIVAIDFFTGKWENISNSKNNTKFVITPRML